MAMAYALLLQGSRRLSLAALVRERAHVLEHAHVETQGTHGHRRGGSVDSGRGPGSILLCAGPRGSWWGGRRRRAAGGLDAEPRDGPRPRAGGTRGARHAPSRTRPP